MYSRIRGVLITFCIIGGPLISSRAFGIDPGAVWLHARGGAREPGGLYQRTGDPDPGRCIALLTSCSQPYMIERCYRSFAALGYRTERHALWCDWSLLHHPLLRADIVSLVLGARMLDGAWIITVRPIVRRTAVRGFPNLIDSSFGFSCAYIHGQLAAIGIEWHAASALDSYPTGITSEISLRAGALRVVINLVPVAERAHAGVIAFELDTGGGFVLLSGYHTGTDQVSAGIVYRAGRYMIGGSWSDHESLGTTITFGVGRLWWR